ncbi:MAG TPA: hypothetical protein VG167_00990 [Verrucomicrobiae bacterium]|nr:hypothetical protein [Verrucomicrobiae bacterium]
MKRLIGVIGLMGLLALALLPGCGKATLEQGGAYAPMTNGVPAAQPDLAFYQVDAAYDLAYSTVDAAFLFERQNRAMLWSVAPEIKKALDQVRPEALKVRDDYAAAREAYLSNPTPAGLSSLGTALAKVKQIAATVAATMAAVLPKQ